MNSNKQNRNKRTVKGINNNQKKDNLVNSKDLERNLRVEISKELTPKNPNKKK